MIHNSYLPMASCEIMDTTYMEVFKDASTPVKKKSNNKPATLSTVNSMPFYIFPPKTCCALSAKITSYYRQKLPYLDNKRKHFCYYV
jgi:hypothetical protein